MTQPTPTPPNTTPIRMGWHAYAERSIPTYATPAQKLHAQRAFYCGVAWLYVTLHERAADPELHRLTMTIRAELDAFLAGIINPTPKGPTPTA